MFFSLVSNILPQSLSVVFWSVFLSVNVCFSVLAAPINSSKLVSTESTDTPEPDLKVQSAFAPSLASLDCEAIFSTKGQILHFFEGSHYYYAIIHSFDSELPAYHLVQLDYIDDHNKCQYLQPLSFPDFEWPSPPMEIQDIWPKADLEGKTSGFYIFTNSSKSQNFDSTSLLTYELSGHQIVPKSNYDLFEAATIHFKVKPLQYRITSNTLRDESLPLGLENDESILEVEASGDRFFFLTSHPENGFRVKAFDAGDDEGAIVFSESFTTVQFDRKVETPRMMVAGNKIHVLLHYKNKLIYWHTYSLEGEPLSSQSACLLDHDMKIKNFALTSLIPGRNTPLYAVVIGSMNEYPGKVVTMPAPFAGQPVQGFPSKQYSSCVMHDVLKKNGSYYDNRIFSLLLRVFMLTVSLHVLAGL